MRFGSRFGALRERNFRLLWIGQGMSAFGDRMAPIALAFAVLDLTGSAADLGYVLAAEVFPMLAFVLIGGVWADRLPRQLVMLVSDLVRAGAQAGIAALLLLHHAQIWELVVLSAVFGTADAFFTPASVGLTPLTVSPERLQEANAFRGLVFSMSAVIGPAFGGAIVALISPGWALAFDAGTFLVSAGSLAMLRIPAVVRAATKTSVVTELKEGWQEVRSRQWLWVSIAYWGIFNITAFPAFRVLGPYVSKSSLGGAGAWATVLTVGGVGSLVGGMIGLRTRPARPLFVCILAMLLWWPPLFFLAIPASVAVIAVAFFAASVGMGWGATLWPTILQQNIPEASISRVSAFDYMGTYVVAPLGYALIGFIAAAIGDTETLVATAGLGVIGTVLTLCVASIRNLRSIEPMAKVTEVAATA